MRDAPVRSQSDPAYTDSPFLPRSGRAKASGFCCVEYLFPYEYDTPALADHSLQQVLFNIHHARRTEGGLANTLPEHRDRIGHIQIADNPGHHQPGTGEINYRFLFDLLDGIGYTGYVGLEYVPLGTREESLWNASVSSAWASWASPWRSIYSMPAIP